MIAANEGWNIGYENLVKSSTVILNTIHLGACDSIAIPSLFLRDEIGVGGQTR